MTSHWEAVKEALRRQGSAAAQRLREETSGPFSEEEVAEIETIVLNHAPAKARLDKLLDTVHAKVLELCPAAAAFLRQKAAYAYPRYSNDLAKGFRHATAVYNDGVEWLTHARRSPGRSAVSQMTEVVVACVLDLQILHENTVVPLMESVQEKRILRRDRGIVGVPVALRFGFGQETRARFIPLGTAMARVLKRFERDPAVRAYLSQIIATEETDPGSLVSAINEQLAAGPPTGKVLTLQELIDAASQIAITRLPSCVRARRTGVAVSHALEIDALERIGGFRKIPKFASAKTADQRTQEETEEEEHEITDEQDTRIELPWRTMLREAVKKNGIDIANLQALAQGLDANGKLIGNYALRLSGKRCRPSTIYRYVLLIADRLMPRLKGRGPASLEEDEWEDLIEQLLDEDVFYHRRSYASGASRDEAGYSQPLLQALRSFALFLHQGEKSSNPISKILPAAGGMKVEANFITVDEYKEALRRIHLWRTDPMKKHLNGAAGAALILGFRLGLRKAEVAYLRASDFDAPVGGEKRVPANAHLHVRSWLLRKLKTSNAERDLPLKVLVPPDELEEVLAFVKKAREAGGARTRLFYSRRNVKKGMKFDDVITLLQSAFRGKEGDRFRVPKFHFHLCRHAAANIWLLKLWPELHEVGTMILHNHEVPPSDSEAGVSEGKDKLPNHNQTIQWISDPGFREKLFGTRILGSDLQAIAHLLGHGSGAVTVEHYLHTLDWYQESAVRQHEPRQQGEITTTRTKPVVDVLLRLAV